MFFLNKCLTYNSPGGLYSEFPREAWDMIRHLLTIHRESQDLYQGMENKMQLLLKATEQDPTLIYLLIVILLFSKGLSMSDDEIPLHDSLAVNRAQSRYIKLLWSYLLSKQGEKKTIIQFIQITSVILQLQLTARQFRGFIYTQLGSTDNVDKLAPLMQSILNII